jgi:phosphotransferase system enzyme I (PtsI)
MSLWLTGIGVSRGIVVGRVHKVAGADLDIPEYTVDTGKVAEEIARFEGALERAREQLEQVRDRIPENTPPEISAFIDTHLLMMTDRAISEGVISLIGERHCNAEWALKMQRDSLARVFDQMEDSYLKTRRDDINHVVSRILRALLNQDRPLEARQPRGGELSILVTREATPADIILLHQQGLAAFITEYGGPLSHTAILAKSLGIPAIVGMHSARRLLSDGEQIIIDGHAGHVLAEPDETALDFYRRRQRRNNRYRRMLGKLRDEPAISLDGEKIQMQANIELPGDTDRLDEVGAEGIGLYRTEFLYLNRQDMPGEEEQLEAYLDVVRAVKGPVTIRTLDLGADKQHQEQRSDTNNPALGLRAIRFCLKDPDMFRVQLRALLRAASEGDVRIMLPMVSTLQELKQARHLLDETRAELRQRGVAFRPDVPLGAMIEIPAAALASRQLARHADFFSIGTNDLIQYTLAIDRVDDEVNYLYDPLHPAVLRLIHMTVDSGARAGIPVAMCGEMAGDTHYTRLLLGLGLTEFSMSPASILEVKRIITQSNIDQLLTASSRILNAGDSQEMRELIDALSA